MTNKLVVIINSLQVRKIKKILLALRSPISVLCPQLNLLPPPSNKIPGYATDGDHGRCVTVEVPTFRSNTPSTRCVCVVHTVTSEDCCLRLLPPEERGTGKVKFTVEQATKAQRGSRGMAVLFL